MRRVLRRRRSNRRRNDNGGVSVADENRVGDRLPPFEQGAAFLSAKILVRQIAVATFIVAAATIVALLLRPRVAATNLAMVYLLGVVATALCCTRYISVAASFASVAAFDFFCVPPYLTLLVSHYEYLITFAGMLVVALVVSTQTARIRTQASAAMGREARTQTLYRLAGKLAGETHVFEMARAASMLAEEVFPCKAVVFFPEEGK